MRSRTNLPVFLGYVVISLAVFGYLLVQSGGEFLFQPVYRVGAVFATAVQLVPGDDVTINGFRVGLVEAVEPAGDAARVELQMHPQFGPLHADARAMIKSKNLLGETYVELVPGDPSSGSLPSGGTIDRDHTLTPVELDQVLDVLNPDTRQRLVVLINEAGAAVSGRGQDLNASLSDLRVVAEALQRIAHSLVSQSDHLDTLIVSLRKVLDTLAAVHSQVRALIGDFDRLMRELASRESDLQGVFVQEDRVMAIFDQALRGGAPQDLHEVIAGGPRFLDDASHYTANGRQAFQTVADNDQDVAALFYELDSVMSYTNPDGSHMWRIEAVQDTPVVDLCAQPNPLQCPQGQRSIAVGPPALPSIPGLTSPARSKP
jgi:phospholipid/cholesterol/gamma-HCH transport system substrate-binding protein